jgi:uncharacterized protein with von Willebrand factor type A (vWA) domain
MSARFRYRAWDGAQAVETLTPDAVLTALADEFLAGGIEQALDRALHRGLTPPAGETLSGLDALRDELRAKRRQLEAELDKALRELAAQLNAGQAGGSTDLEPAARRLLEALAAQPTAAARLLAGVDAATGATISAALSGQPAAAGSGAEQLGDTSAGGGVRCGFDALAALTAIDQLEANIRRVRSVDDMGDIDPALVQALLGEAAVERLERLARSLGRFANSGFIRRGVGKRQELSARALQVLGEWLLTATLQRLHDRQGGDRLAPARLSGHELSGATRAYQFGDALTLDLSRTELEAVKRGPGVPVKLDARDFAVFEREETSRAATVLAIDLSRSMGERGYLLAAKRLALALEALLRARFPRDELLLLGFSEGARPLTAADLPSLTWDRYGFGTNIQDALRLGRGLLAGKRGGQRNLILITDGEPTAHRETSGAVRFNHPPTPETLAATYAEAERLRRDGVGLAVCLLSEQRQVVRFAEELTRRGAGELLTTTPDDLAVVGVLRYGRSRKGRLS